MSGYEKEKNLFYHLIIWIYWIKIFLPSKEGREAAHDDDGGTSYRVSRRASSIVQEKDISFSRKGKVP